MTIADLIKKLQALPDHSRPVFVALNEYIGDGSELTGPMFEDRDAEFQIRDLETRIVIDAE